MKNFEYVSKTEYEPVKQDLIKLINLVEDEVRDKFTFRYDFIASSSNGIFIIDKEGNIDVNVFLSDDIDELMDDN